MEGLVSAIEINTSFENVQKTEVDLSLVPEHLRPREYGKREVAPIPVSRIIRVSQQRGTSNPAFEAIKQSIESGDMINQPDIGIVNRESLEQYFNFINRLWGSNHHIDDFEPDSEGNYYLAEAGHTRVDAVESLELEKLKRAIAEGYDISSWPEPTIWVKLHRDQTPEDILRLQLDENLHEKPSQERTAIAMVETYFYGLEQGKWSSKEEFVAVNNKFSRHALEAALAFCELDEIIRSYVFTGAVSYGPVVEIGKGVSLHRNYLANRYFGVESFKELDLDTQAEVEEQIMLWNASEVALIQNKKMNITAAKKRHQSFRNEWKKENTGTEDQGSFLIDPLQEWRAYRARTRRELRSHINELVGARSEGALRALQLHVNILQPNTEEGSEIFNMLESGLRSFNEKFQRTIKESGGVAVSKITNYLDEQLLGPNITPDDS